MQSSHQQPPQRRNARRARRVCFGPLGLVLAALGVVVATLTAWSPVAAAQARELEACPADDEFPTGDSVVRIVKVAGLIDPVVKSYLLDELAEIEQRADDGENVVGLVIWLDSNASVLDDRDYIELAAALESSPVTTAAWVGQSGSTARGGAAELLGVVDVVGVAQGATIGDTGPARLPGSGELGPAFGDATERLETATIGAEEAIQLGISVGPLGDVSAIASFVSLLPGYEVGQCLTSDGDGAGADGEAGAATGDDVRSFPLTRNELSGPSLTAQLFHTVASPEVAYLLFVMGLGLLVFELFTAGIGIAGVLGAGLLALGSYGLGVLPTRWWAIGLFMLAFFLMAVDVQTNVPRYHTVAGLAAFTVGTFGLYQGLSMSWVTIIAGLVGAVLYAYGGMPSMVRTRFSTPTIGRRWMIGEMGSAVTDVSPEGTVEIRDASWRAITNRATPVKAGDPVRVTGIDRLVLEIEPEEGGAKDYRQRR